jgi:hypothetical protein
MKKTYRKLVIKKELDDRFDVYEKGYVIAENFQTMGLAMTWVDTCFYN